MFFVVFFFTVITSQTLQKHHKKIIRWNEIINKNVQLMNRANTQSRQSSSFVTFRLCFCCSFEKQSKKSSLLQRQAIFFRPFFSLRAYKYQVVLFPLASTGISLHPSAPYCSLFSNTHTTTTSPSFPRSHPPSYLPSLSSSFPPVLPSGPPAAYWLQAGV